MSTFTTATNNNNNNTTATTTTGFSSTTATHAGTTAAAATLPAATTMTSGLTATSLEHRDVSLRERTEAVAEVAPRGRVVAEARVETNAGAHFAEAADEKRRSVEAGVAKELAHSEHENAHPAKHAAGFFSGIADKVGGALDKAKDGHALKKHEKAAESEAERARREEIASKEAARLAAIREAEGRAAATNHSAIVSEYGNGREFVAVAEVPARGATVGTGVAVSHADDHLLKAAREQELAAEAAAAREAASARVANAHPVGEVKASAGGIGTKISAKLHEAKEWMSEKRHDKHATTKEASAAAELERDAALAREKAKAAAEAEAARLDRGATARIVDERTTTVVTTNATRA